MSLRVSLNKAENVNQFYRKVVLVSWTLTSINVARVSL